MKGGITMRRQPGLTFQEAVNVARKRVKDDQLYLISRHWLWFSPGARGYTLELARVGVFTATEARSYIDVDGLSVTPLSAMAGVVDSEIARTERALESLRAIRARLVSEQEREGGR